MAKLSKTKSGFVAIVGASNVGKSTLINCLVGTKVSIVSPKVQTTRMLIKGIRIHHLSQIIFVDTPGIFAPKRRLDRAMVACAWSSTGESDEIVLVLDSARGFDSYTHQIVKHFQKNNIKAILVLNKIDKIKKENLLLLASEMSKTEVFSNIFMISALKNEGINDLLDHLESKMPLSPWLFPKTQLSEIPERILAEEITREKLYLLLHQELPYEAMVETSNWVEKKDGTTRIEQIVLVKRPSQKAIIIGKNGQKIKVD